MGSIDFLSIPLILIPLGDIDLPKTTEQRRFN